jgi:D-amino-acid dehydrogenase
MTDAIVLGAGMVGVSVAIHLQRRGRSVILIDRREPGRETSFGNAGIIQKEAVKPYTFPRDLKTLLRVARNRSIDVRYHVNALPGLATVLARYWWYSAPRRYRRIVADYATLIEHVLSEHGDLVTASGAENLIVRQGYLRLHRTQEGLDTAFADADAKLAAYGVGHRRLTNADVARLEPNLRIAVAGAVHWQEPWTVRDPGSLVGAYARYFAAIGGTITTGDAATLRQVKHGWRIETTAGPVEASDAVLALGPWAGDATRRLGYRLPLFVKRGYHMHYGAAADAKLNNWLYDGDNGYLITPMQRGVRLTTGAEFAAQSAPPTPDQLDAAELVARDLFPLGDRIDPAPWIGARPCTPDMKPIIGPAPRHRGLWFAFGHAHHGFTLGPVTGRLLAERMTGETPFLNLAPFAAERFG